MSEKRTVADLVQEAINKGANTAEEIHRSIANLPLKVLEEIEFFKGPVKEVRRIQDRSIGALYDLIRRINQEVAKLAGQMLKAPSASPGKRPAPARSGRKARPKR